MLEPELRMHWCPKSSPRVVLLRGGPDHAGLCGPPGAGWVVLELLLTIEYDGLLCSPPKKSTTFRASLEQTQHPPQPSVHQNLSPPRRARTIGDGGCLPGGMGLGPAPAPAAPPSGEK